MAKTINELIDDWLDGKITVDDYSRSIPDKWRAYLIQAGYTFNDLPEAQIKYFRDNGYTGNTFNECYQKWLDVEIYP